MVPQPNCPANLGDLAIPLQPLARSGKLEKYGEENNQPKAT